MKRLAIFIISLLVCSSSLLSAQEKDRHNFEAGAGINIYGILGVMGGPSREFGPGIHFEYRYDYSDRVDFGGRLYYKYGEGHSAFTGEPTWGLVYNQVGLKAVTDFNMRPGKLVRPYIGAGLGAGAIHTHRISAQHNDDTALYGTIGPRIGLQIWRLRLALEFDFAFDGQYGFLSTETATSLTLSYTF